MTKHNRISLFAIDLDDTLLDDEWHVSGTNAAALARLSSSDVDVCIISGRMPSSMEHVIEGLPFIRYISCYHGALIRDLHQHTTIWECPLALQGLADILAWADQKGYRLMYFMGNGAVGEARDPIVSYYEKRTGINVIIPSNNDRNPLGQFEIHKMLVYDPTVSHPSQNRSDSEDKLYMEALEIKPRDTRFFKTGLGYIEFTHANATKSAAITTLCSILNVPAISCAAIGDSYNDLDMIQSAGLSFAVSNAVQAVKTAASYIVADNVSDGVAEAAQIILQKNKCS